MKTFTRRSALGMLSGATALVAAGIGLGLAIPGLLGRAFGTAAGQPSSADGMMGSATSADMGTYMDMFSRHTEIRRSVELIPGGVTTTTESDDSALTSQLQAHVSAMYAHLDRGQVVDCMSSSLPTLFIDAKRYKRDLTFSAKGVVVIETSSDPALVKAIRAHAQEVSGFVRDGMPSMMKGMMG